MHRGVGTGCRITEDVRGVMLKNKGPKIRGDD